MDKSESDFVAAYKQFLDDHHNCPDGPEHMLTHVWLPKGRTECAVTFTCICGARVVLPATRKSGAAIVAACRLNGIPVTESTAAEGVH